MKTFKKNWVTLETSVTKHCFALSLKIRFNAKVNWLNPQTYRNQAVHRTAHHETAAFQTWGTCRGARRGTGPAPATLFSRFASLRYLSTTHWGLPRLFHAEPMVMILSLHTVDKWFVTRESNQSLEISELSQYQSVYSLVILFWYNKWCKRLFFYSI